MLASHRTQPALFSLHILSLGGIYTFPLLSISSKIWWPPIFRSIIHIAPLSFRLTYTIASLKCPTWMFHRHFQVNKASVQSLIFPLKFSAFSISVNGTTIHTIAWIRKRGCLFDSDLSALNSIRYQCLLFLPSKYFLTSSTSLLFRSKYYDPHYQYLSNGWPWWSPHWMSQLLLFTPPV